MKFLLKYIIVLLSLHFHVTLSDISANKTTDIVNIPDGLLFGAGTSAFQVEGALKTHGRSESFFEWFLTHSNRRLSDSYQIASDSYNKYKEDVKVLKYIGLHIYRFSMSWTRLLPTGYANYVNQEGMDYYHAVLDELEQAGIEPMVQLNHFDHPAAFEKFGGWQNESMIELFKDYSRFVFKEFGHRVKYFLTFNEPNVYCNILDSAVITSGENEKSKFPKMYICSHNLLKAHAEVYHMYHAEFNPDKKGMISINLLCNDFFVEDEKDQQLTDIAFEFSCGWFAHPIYSQSGDYSNILKERVNESNSLRATERIELPTFSESWIKKIRGTADFFGLSYYSTRIVKSAPVNDTKSWFNWFTPPEARLILKAESTWPITANGNYIVPKGLKSILKRIKHEYNNPPVHIVENGFGDRGKLKDENRIKFIYDHVEQIIRAMNHDKCDVKSYIYWSLIDNHEFWGGYKTRFGLAYIDDLSPNRTRTPKESAKWLKNVLSKRQLYIEK